MKLNTLMLSGVSLDWAAAKSAGYFDNQPEYWDSAAGALHFVKMRDVDTDDHGVHWTHSSTEWDECGPIIQRERIELSVRSRTNVDIVWYATIKIDEQYFDALGPDPLIAAMRCFVATKLGYEVDIPASLFEVA